MDFVDNVHNRFRMGNDRIGNGCTRYPQTPHPGESMDNPDNVHNRFGMGNDKIGNGCTRYPRYPRSCYPSCNPYIHGQGKILPRRLYTGLKLVVGLRGCRAGFRPCSFRKKSPSGKALPLLIFRKLHSAARRLGWGRGISDAPQGQ